MTAYKWVSFVVNPEHPNFPLPIMLGVSDNVKDAIVAIQTEADLIGHDDVSALITEADLNRMEHDLTLQIMGASFDNGDGIVYAVHPVHDIDGS